MIAQVDKITKYFAGNLLYAHVTLQLNAHERWALVGPNGSGKTTLLNIFAGRMDFDEGSLHTATGVSIGYLEQDFSTSEQVSAKAYVVQAAEEAKCLEARIAELESLIESSEDSEHLQVYLEEYGHAQDRFERLGGWELESRAAQILSGLGFAQDDMQKLASEFSGGWKMRLALARLLFTRPDVLLLDEPTNHLDLDSVMWLKNFLQDYEGAVLIVSHDRAFMDGCVSHVAAIENKTLQTYVGSYTSYLKQREDNLAQLQAKRTAQLREIDHLQVFIDRFRYKPTKAKQVQERVKRLEHLKEELVVLPEAHSRMRITFPPARHTAEKILELDDVRSGYGDHIVADHMSATVYREDKIALVGFNGAGKSTLLKIISHKLHPQAGTYRLTDGVEISYFSQHHLDQLNPSNTVLSELNEVCPEWATQEQRRLLGAFLFVGDDVFKSVGVLSGGERARLALAKILAAPAPLLVLDEPTNHLDIASIEVLEDALKRFNGTFILCSHDEKLIRKVCTRVFEIHEGKLYTFEGDYEYYLEHREYIHDPSASLTAPATMPRTKDTSESVQQTSSGRNTKTREQKRLEAELRKKLNALLKPHKSRMNEIERQMSCEQEEKDALEKLLADPEYYQKSDTFEAGLVRYHQLKTSLETLEDEWCSLAEVCEQLAMRYTETTP